MPVKQWLEFEDGECFRYVNNDLVKRIPAGVYMTKHDNSGSYLQRDEKPIVVCCEPGFWRKGNIEMVCDRYEIPLFDKYEEAVEYTRALVDNWHTEIEIW